MKYKNTIEELYNKIYEILKNKIEKINRGLNLTFEARDSDYYPSNLTCEKNQYIWINDEEYIKIKYEYDEIEKEKKDLILNIQFKDKNILQALDVLICIVHESPGDRESIKIKFNEIELEIYPADIEKDKEEDSLSGYFVIVDQENLLRKINTNIKKVNEFRITTKSWNVFYTAACISFNYESYDHDEDYLYNIERKRINKIIEKNK